MIQGFKLRIPGREIKDRLRLIAARYERKAADERKKYEAALKVLTDVTKLENENAGKVLSATELLVTGAGSFNSNAILEARSNAQSASQRMREYQMNVIRSNFFAGHIADEDYEIEAGTVDTYLEAGRLFE